MNAMQLAAVDRSIRQENKCLTMETPPIAFVRMMGNFGIASGNGMGSLTLSSFKSDSILEAVFVVQSLPPNMAKNNRLCFKWQSFCSLEMELYIMKTIGSCDKQFR